MEKSRFSVKSFPQLPRLGDRCIGFVPFQLKIAESLKILCKVIKTGIFCCDMVPFLIVVLYSCILCIAAKPVAPVLEVKSAES